MTAIAVALVFAFSFQPQSAQARYRGLIGGAIVGGVAAAIIAGQAANQPRRAKVRSTSGSASAQQKAPKADGQQADGPAGNATAAKAQSDGPSGGDKFGNMMGSSLAN